MVVVVVVVVVIVMMVVFVVVVVMIVVVVVVDHMYRGTWTVDHQVVVATMVSPENSTHLMAPSWLPWALSVLELMSKDLRMLSRPPDHTWMGSWGEVHNSQGQDWYEDFEPKSDIKIGRLFLAFFGVFLAFLRYYTIVYLSNSSALSNNFFKINNFKDFLKELLVFF